jgi:hypothetical protein
VRLARTLVSRSLRSCKTCASARQPFGVGSSVMEVGTACLVVPRGAARLSARDAARRSSRNREKPRRSV